MAEAVGHGRGVAAEGRDAKGVEVPDAVGKGGAVGVAVEGECVQVEVPSDCLSVSKMWVADVSPLRAMSNRAGGTDWGGVDEPDVQGVKAQGSAECCDAWVVAEPRGVAGGAVSRFVPSKMLLGVGSSAGSET